MPVLTEGILNDVVKRAIWGLLNVSRGFFPDCIQSANTKSLSTIVWLFSFRFGRIKADYIPEMFSGLAAHKSPFFKERLVWYC